MEKKIKQLFTKLKRSVINFYLAARGFLGTLILDGGCPTYFTRSRYWNIAITKRQLKAFYPIYNESLKTLLEVIDLLTTEVKEGVDEQFNKATLILLSRSIQHFESIVVLTENGLYGDATALSRNILSDMLMFSYLHLHLELIDLFLKEKSSDYKSNKKFKEAFRESKMIEEMEKRGGSVLSKESFSKISKSLHASSWGIQYYARENSTGLSHHLKYGPGYEFKKSLMMLAVILSGPWDYLTMIISHREIDKLDVSSENWKRIKKKISQLEKPVKKLSVRGLQILMNWERYKRI